MKEINPSLENTFGEKIDLYNELEQMYEHQISRASKQLFCSARAIFIFQYLN